MLAILTLFLENGKAVDADGPNGPVRLPKTAPQRSPGQLDAGAETGPALAV
jgi:hypothetical protein